MKGLKLNKLENQVLENRQMQSTLGGEEPHRWCGCACAYANTGGSGIEANKNANYDQGPHGAWSVNAVSYYIKEEGMF